MTALSGFSHRNDFILFMAIGRSYVIIFKSNNYACIQCVYLHVYSHYEWKSISLNFYCQKH